MRVQNLKFVALSVPEIIGIEVLHGGCEPRTPNVGEEEGIGGRSGMVPFERALVSCYALHSTFPLSLRV